MSPHYDIEELKAACGEAGKVYIPNTVLSDAEADFRLYSQKEVCDFIADDGLENLCHQNTKELEKNPCPEYDIMVDAYEFLSGKKLGYIAFYFNPKTKKWIIKSFKRNTKERPKNNLLEQQLRLAFSAVKED